MNALRLVAAFAGIVVALLAIIFDSRQLGWIAIGCLAFSVIARLVLRRRSRS